MEMRDLNSTPLEDEPTDEGVDPAAAQSSERADRASPVPQAGLANQRTELYARLRAIIDNATESIRVLKEENAALAARNAEMGDRIGMLEYRIRAITAHLADDELALRRSAEALEQVLISPPAAAPPPESVAPPTPLHAGAPVSALTAPQPTEPSTTPASIAMPPGAEMTESQRAADEPTPVPEPETLAAPPMGPVAAATEAAPAAQSAARSDDAYTLVAYPFVRFSDLGQFQAALQKLGGVHDVQVRRFAQGTLEMRIGYTGTTDLATTLRTLTTEVEDVQEEEPSRLRVRLRTGHEG